MTMRIFRLAVMFVGILAPLLCRGHNWNVHEFITDNAFQTADSLTAFLDENLEAATLEATVPLAKPNVQDSQPSHSG